MFSFSFPKFPAKSSPKFQAFLLVGLPGFDMSFHPTRSSFCYLTIDETHLNGVLENYKSVELCGGDVLKSKGPPNKTN